MHGSCENVIVTPEGEWVCLDTGEVLKENSFAEYMVVPRHSSTPETATPVSFKTHDMNIGARMSDYSSARNPLKRGLRTSKYATSSISRSEVPTITALQKLKELVEILKIPASVHETAALILRSYLDSVSRRPGRVEQYVAASIAKAVEIHGIPISIGEVAKAAGVEIESVQKAILQMSETEVVKNLVRKSIVKARFRGSSTKMRRIEEFINRLVSNLGLDPEVKRIALEFVRVSLKAGSGANIKTFHGKKSAALAAAAVYLAARLLNYDVSQKKIASMLELKESNIRKHYRFLIDNVAIIVYV
ncbi:transcription initiation factor IIB family protein [Aeropyrum camini]|uniref:Transcription initiation factor IIB n=1 Tax=Aeropyrum camini SY1 = JCM 12091 TaxID=1198449 RepID=U3T924_9CREN|nr:transcription initiation factor IIB family protein [Aeropyrum camini]BAN90022.1 transcription initiation factor IIB [Aeropyrum camini SY1 = JCM 12091]